MSTDLKVFISTRDSTCDECGENLGTKAWITLSEDRRAFCLACADLDHLLFRPSGDAALTRRAGKYSTLSAVVLKWSRARKQYERQGLLVEEQALERAEQECLADSDARARSRERNAVRCEESDARFVQQFADMVRSLFPGLPAGRALQIAQHACLKYSGRIGRTASAKSLAEEAVRLAVIAHIRHRETPYDELVATGRDRHEARDMVWEAVQDVVERWEGIQDLRI